MIVSGTPDELKELPEVNEPGSRRIEIESRRHAAAPAWLQSQSFCPSATIFGQNVHAVVDAKLTDDELAERLHHAGFSNASTRAIAPSLEDVFVALTQRAAAREGQLKRVSS